MKILFENSKGGFNKHLNPPVGIVVRKIVRRLRCFFYLNSKYLDFCIEYLRIYTDFSIEKLRVGVILC